MSEEDVLTFEQDSTTRQRPLVANQSTMAGRRTRHSNDDDNDDSRNESSGIDVPRRQPLRIHERYILKLTNDNINAFSGAIAGVASGIAVCPLDVAKTRLQAQGGFSALMKVRDPTIRAVLKYSGFAGTLTTIWKEEGVKGLYRGLAPIVIGYIPTWTVYFMLYEKSKNFLATTELGEKPFITHVISAIISGTTSTLITNPIWVVKTRLMSQNANSSWHYKSTVDAFRTMYREEGIKVFYSGIGPALLGLSHVAVQFPLYERLKASFVTPQQDELTHNLAILACSGISKVSASAITYPHEVLRTRNQIQPNGHASSAKYRGIWRTARTIYLEEGWRAFYAGMGTNLFRAVPSSAVTLFTYEFVSRHLKEYQHVLQHDEMLE